MPHQTQYVTCASSSGCTHVQDAAPATAHRVQPATSLAPKDRRSRCGLCHIVKCIPSYDPPPLLAPCCLPLTCGMLHAGLREERKVACSVCGSSRAVMHEESIDARAYALVRRSAFLVYGESRRQMMASTSGGKSSSERSEGVHGPSSTSCGCCSHTELEAIRATLIPQIYRCVAQREWTGLFRTSSIAAGSCAVPPMVAGCNERRFISCELVVVVV